MSGEPTVPRSGVRHSDALIRLDDKRGPDATAHPPLAECGTGEQPPLFALAE